MIDLLQEKAAQAFSAMETHNIDVWLLFGQEEPHGSDPIYPLLMGNREAGGFYVLVRPGRRAVAIVNGLDEMLPKSTGVWNEVIVYRGDMWKSLKDLLEEINPAHIGINYSQQFGSVDGITHGRYLNLMAAFEGHPLKDRFVSAEKLALTLRTCKTPAEIAAIKATIAKTDIVFDRLRGFLRPNMSGMEIFDFIQAQIVDLGCGFGWSQYNDPILTMGPVPFMGHTPPPEGLSLQKGSLMQVDLGLRYNGYCSDFQRMFYVLQDGESAPPEPVQRLFDTVHGCITCMIEAVKPGQRNDYCTSIAFPMMAAAGYPEPLYSAGHQLGRSVHDGGFGLLDYRNPRPDCIMEVGNVFTVEGLETRLEGYGWVSLEEDVVVTETGCEILTNRQDEIWLVR